MRLLKICNFAVKEMYLRAGQNSRGKRWGVRGPPLDPPRGRPSPRRDGYNLPAMFSSPFITKSGNMCRYLLASRERLYWPAVTPP